MGKVGGRGKHTAAGAGEASEKRVGGKECPKEAWQGQVTAVDMEPGVRVCLRCILTAGLPQLRHPLPLEQSSVVRGAKRLEEEAAILGCKHRGWAWCRGQRKHRG